MDELAEKVMRAVADHAKSGMVGPEASFAELGIDSLDFVALVQSVEEALGIMLSDEEVAGASTVADLIAACRRVTAEGPSA
jgi:acyl carrier protein